ncbi:embryonic polarity protein dorsal isoform X1 [Acyrthosiphon pisum]|uniref:RHD domain-containing protein n=2 Tax=Acyrthosiphon pisum TaxID=7029 RepID=A0A8R2A252_ACYPI|nr:embryonic polarity protein dorsal isoform X1 [Acyrthosiphon pisum]|eukprot:XP_001949498.2 PREDICTED: embryonic polarity protein dorsal isoform X1 [Acyrthosiphon pisum]
MDLNDKQSNIPDLHLSDVIEVIEEHVRTKTVQQMDAPSSNNGRRPTTSPYIKIVEQPASKALRFRYECEGRSAGSIPGVNSSTENKTYPTIQIVGYKGRAVVVVSCVTKDRPYRPHPHNLVGRDNCKKGICTIEINNESMAASFQNLGIQCVKRKDIDEALRVREEIRVDPFRTGFSHKENPTSIDLNAVRLCFQAFLGGTQKGKYSILEPIVSDPIYDKKAMSDLSICRLSDAAASVVGDKEIILLCEKVTKDDIQVRFFEEKDGKCIWEDYGVFKASDVHKQVAIWFKTPKYKITEIDSPVNVWIQLKRPSDGMCSDALPFTFTPDYSDPVMLKRKRQKLSSESELLIQLPSNPIRLIEQSSSFIDGMVDQLAISVPIKEEPETSPNPYSGLYPLSNPSVLQHSPLYNSRTPSPHDYQYPNVNPISLYGQTTILNTNIRLPAGIQTSGCTITKVCPTVNNHNPTSQKNYALPTTITTTPLPCPTEDNNESNLMEATLPSLDSSDLRTLLGDSEHVLSTNLSASLHLTENSARGESIPEIVVEDNINMSDSFDRIADNTLKEFCEFYTKRN